MIHIVDQLKRRENSGSKEPPRESRIRSLAKEDAWRSEQLREKFPSLRTDAPKDPRTRSESSPIKVEDTKMEESWGVPKELLPSKPETPKAQRKEIPIKKSETPSDSPKDPRRSGSWPQPLMATLKKENSKENLSQEPQIRYKLFFCQIYVPRRAPTPVAPTSISSILNPSNNNDKPTTSNFNFMYPLLSASNTSISSLMNPSSPTLSPSSFQSLTQLPPRSGNSLEKFDNV